MAVAVAVAVAAAVAAAVGWVTLAEAMRSGRTTSTFAFENAVNSLTKVRNATYPGRVPKFHSSKWEFRGHYLNLSTIK